jgi:hypothetical protein
VSDRDEGGWTHRETVDESAWVGGEEEILVEAVSADAYDYALINFVVRTPTGEELERSEMLLNPPQTHWLITALQEVLRLQADGNLPLQLVAEPPPEPPTMSLFDFLDDPRP